MNTASELDSPPGPRDWLLVGSTDQRPRSPDPQVESKIRNGLPLLSSGIPWAKGRDRWAALRRLANAVAWRAAHHLRTAGRAGVCVLAHARNELARIREGRGNGSPAAQRRARPWPRLRVWKA